VVGDRKNDKGGKRKVDAKCLCKILTVCSDSEYKLEDKVLIGRLPCITNKA
jgi:hypothetical protein